MNKAAIRMSFCGAIQLFLLGLYPEVELLGHSALEIGPCLVLINNAKHF